MLENCEKKINKDEINEILTPENILTTDEKYLNLLNFSNEIFMNPFYEIVFTDEEKNILKEINTLSPSEDFELKLEDMEKDLLTRNEKLKFIGIGAGATLVVFIIFFLSKIILSRKNKNQIEKKNK